MLRYGIVITVMMSLFLALFGLMEALHFSFLQDPTPWMKQGNLWAAGFVGCALLIGDVFLPVPSSLVMIAHGALLGTALGGTVSLLGSTGSAVLGFWVGRKGGKLLARLITEKEKARADVLLQNWGALAILITRPIPILAETVSILAGSSRMGWGKMLVASIAGTIPAAYLYALAGSSAKSYAFGVLVFGGVLLISGIFWFIGKIAASKL